MYGVEEEISKADIPKSGLVKPKLISITQY